MARSMFFAPGIFLAAVVALVALGAPLGSVNAAGVCESPKHSASSYSTLDGFFHYGTTYIVEFALQCANNVKDVQFYSVVNEAIQPIATSEETSKYQVSWQAEHSASGAQDFLVHIYDEEGIAAYKRAAAAAAGGGGDPVSVAKPLFSITHHHAGVSRKPPISPESVLLLVAGVAVYYATVAKAQFKS